MSIYGEATPLQVGCWVIAEDGAKISYVVAQMDDRVEFSFRGGRECFELLLSEQALERCVALFPQALHQLRVARLDQRS